MLEPGDEVSLDLWPERSAWVQMARGTVSLNGTALKAGDGAAVLDEGKIHLTSEAGAEVLIFDLA